MLPQCKQTGIGGRRCIAYGLAGEWLAVYSTSAFYATCLWTRYEKPRKDLNQTAALLTSDYAQRGRSLGTVWILIVDFAC